MTGKSFAEESGLMGEIKQRNEDLFILTREDWNHHYVRAAYCSEQGWVRGAVNAFCDAGYRQGVGAMRYEQAFNTFRDRRNEDIQLAQQTKLIPFHQKELAKEIKEREGLERYLEKIDRDRVKFDR